MKQKDSNPTEFAIKLLNAMGKLTIAVGLFLMFLAAIFPLEDGNLLVRGMMVLIPFFCASLLYTLLMATAGIVHELHQISQNLSMDTEKR